MKIELVSLRDGARFQLAGSQYILFVSQDMRFGDNPYTQFEMIEIMVGNASEMVLFYGPQNRLWTLKYLSEYVFGGVTQEKYWALANLMARIAESVAELDEKMLPKDGALDVRIVEQMRTKWFEWSCEVVKGFPWEKREAWIPYSGVGKEEEATIRLVTACQFAFNQWIYIGEEVFEFGVSSKRMSGPGDDLE